MTSEQLFEDYDPEMEDVFGRNQQVNTSKISKFQRISVSDGPATHRSVGKTENRSVEETQSDSGIDSVGGEAADHCAAD